MNSTPSPGTRYDSPRPVGDPYWASFVRWAESPGSGVNPDLTRGAGITAFGIHGWLIWLAFRAGADTGRFEILNGHGEGI